jgi:hypothetical protein
MAEIEKRNGKYRARYREPFGRRRSKTFLRKTEAERLWSAKVGRGSNSVGKC